MATDKNKLHLLSWLQGIELFEANFDDMVFSRHAHAGFAVGAITKGVGGYMCRGSNHLCPPRTLSLMNPEEPHTGHAVDGALHYKMLYISESTVRHLLEVGTPTGFHQINPMDHDGLITRHFLQLARQLNRPDATGRLGIEETLVTLLACVFSRHGGSSIRAAGKENKAIRRAIEMMHDHVNTQPTAPLSISDIAGEVGLNGNYFIQSFSKQRGISPRQYLILTKIHRAKQMIASGGSPLQVALDLGFYDQSHFIRHFRKINGITPQRLVVHHP
ncbi:AraC family transcriptional regulator [Polycladidibacter stylochi]|uniref:AraC family transcriptional regulator n=1 Tax=Polycladidibacter stylochi TaxID=1807766 RepID=UPI00082D239C|nr:AraC family transcriptional regulator [Pseudovibrio stylochi]